MTDLNASWDEALRGPRMSEATGRVIFKYQMPVKEAFSIDLPKDAQIIRVQDLDGMFWLWAIVDTNAPMEKRFFRAFKTGAKIPDDFDTSHYLGMCAVFIQMELGLYIFEDVQAKEQIDRIKERFQVVEPPVNMSETVQELVQKKDSPVIDVKLSKVEPDDMVGIPTFHEATDQVYEDSKKQLKMDIDEVILDFEDVFRPLIEELQGHKPMNQNRIDEIEAWGGFDEEE